ncbi:MAG: OmpA family protein [Vicinamibacterales bacterium]
MRKSIFVMATFALTLAVAPACATKGFVRESVGEVNDKVSSVSDSLEETQERVRQNEGQINEAQQSAKNAQDAANAADAKAGEVGKTAAARADAIEASARKLLFEVVVSEDQGEFKFGGAELPDQAKQALDDMVSQIQNQKNAVWIEIEGHTDSTGSKTYNEELGMERAEAVKRYLYEQHHVPLHKMNVISYGEDKPVAPNNTREGRAQNRRVVVKVLA